MRSSLVSPRPNYTSSSLAAGSSQLASARGAPAVALSEWHVKVLPAVGDTTTEVPHRRWLPVDLGRISCR